MNPKSAESYSKLIMLAFFLSYVYMVFSVGGNPNGGWLGATLFLVLGLFGSSIVIAISIKRCACIYAVFLITHTTTP